LLTADRPLLTVKSNGYYGALRTMHLPSNDDRSKVKS